MSKMEIAKKLAEMTRSMEEARTLRNAKVKKIYHQTNPEGWEALKQVLNYSEPAMEERGA
ncbi:MAG: hypothetical protein ACI95C_002405 [Pseudohongiellaceae bacterium]|jgi:hypothetical protein